MYQVDWIRNLHERWPRLTVHEGTLLVTERHTRLCKVSTLDGSTIWEVKVKNSYGNITAHGNNVYYRTHSLIIVINFVTGEIINRFEFEDSHLRYVSINNQYLFLGSWKGYIELRTFSDKHQWVPNWKKSIAKEKFKPYTVPIIVKDYCLLLNHVEAYLKKIDINTGNDLWKLDIPSGIEKHGFSLEIVNGKLIVFSKLGEIYNLDESNSEWVLEVEHDCKIETNHAKVLQSQYIFRDIKNNICSYDISTKKLRWKFLANHFYSKLSAIELDDNNSLVACNMSKQIIFDKDGAIVSKMKSERRYGSDFFKIEDDIFYLTKSTLKKLKLV